MICGRRRSRAEAPVAQAQQLQARQLVVQQAVAPAGTGASGFAISREERVMILGMSADTFTQVHVALSLVGIVSGLIVLFGMLGAKKLDGWAALFLATTVLTSVTGFFFPAASVMPSHVLGILSLVFLAAALMALYVYHLAGSWRWIYVVGAVVALYFNVFVGIVQAFMKVPFLQPLAPTQSEPPFLVAQLVVMAIFIVLGILAVRNFHPAKGA
jgi:hypothetical protein